MNSHSSVSEIGVCFIRDLILIYQDSKNYSEIRRLRCTAFSLDKGPSINEGIPWEGVDDFVTIAHGKESRYLLITSRIK